jgi:AhpC/TSA family
MFLTEAKSLEQSLNEAFHKADTLEAPLGARLSFYLGESRKLLPDLEATYDQLVERIKANGADAMVPAVGEKMPNFLMTDSDGQLVELSALIAKGPLVISFNRGPWCDYCGLELRALARAYPEIVAAGGEVVSIVPETVICGDPAKGTECALPGAVRCRPRLCAAPWACLLGG